MLNLFHKLNFKNIRRQNSFNLSKIILVFLISLSFLTVTGNVFGEVILDKQLIRPDDILKEEVEVTPSIPTYSLPLRVKDINFLLKASLYYKRMVLRSFLLPRTLQIPNFILDSHPRKVHLEMILSLTMKF